MWFNFGTIAVVYIVIKKMNVKNSGPPSFAKVHPVEESWLRYCYGVMFR